MATKVKGRKNTIVEDRQVTRRQFLKGVAAAAAAGGAVLLLPSCAGPAATPTPAELTAGIVDTARYKKDPPWDVGRSGMGEVNSWQVVKTLHHNYGFTEKYAGLFGKVHYTQANWDPAQQVADLEDLLTRDIDVLFIHPVTGGNCISHIEEAMERGIPVILGGARAYTDKYVSYVDRDNYAVGKGNADYVARRINYSGTVVLMMGAPGNTYTEDVMRGVREGLARYPNIKEAGLEYAEWSPALGKTKMEALMASVPQIDGVINDGGDMGIGIIDAYVDAKLPIPPMIGGTINGFLRKAKEHNVKFIASYSGAELGLTEVDIAVKVLRGEPVPKNILPDVISFEETDIDKYYRPDLSDEYFALGYLPEDWIQEHFAK
jgi:ribose transport system substrate-binding protein